MAQEILKQVNFNVGEIDPRAADREDLKVYYAGLEYAENLVPLPVGPMERRPGLSFVDYVRHTLAEVPFTTPMVGAFNGGATPDILAPEGTWFTTTAGMGAGDYVILGFDFGAPVDIALIDLIDYAAKDPAAVPTPDPAPFTYPWPGLSGPINLGFGGGEGLGGFSP